MVRRRLRKILRATGPEGVAFFAVGSFVAGALILTVAGAPIGIFLLAVVGVLGALATATGVGVTIAPLIL